MKNGDYILVTAPENYPGKKYRNKYCYEHYLVYWKNHNILPSQEQVIHHKDENKKNNSLENLELIDRVEHIVFHNSNKKTKMVVLCCLGCLKIFIKEKRQTHLIKNNTYTCCSKKCANLVLKLSKQEKQERISNNVIEEFSGNLKDYL